MPTADFKALRKTPGRASVKIAGVSVQVPITNHKNTPQSQNGTAGSQFVKTVAYLNHISETLVAQTAFKKAFLCFYNDTLQWIAL